MRLCLFIVGMRIMGEMGLIRAMSHINLISPIAPVLPINFISIIFPLVAFLITAAPTQPSALRALSGGRFFGVIFLCQTGAESPGEGLIEACPYGADERAYKVVGR